MPRSAPRPAVQEGILIVVQLCGGLGNQMFQYALGRHLSLATGSRLRFDLALLADDPQRSFALGGFCIAGAVATADEIAELPLAPRHGWVARVMRRFSRDISVREKAFPFDPQILAATPPTYLRGYWQSEKYFAQIAPQIRQDFRLTSPMVESRGRIAGEIEATQAISVHVRRGDYVSNATANAYHGTCSPEWYERAMSHLASVVENPVFFVFSDDPDWARRNLRAKGRMKFVAPQSDIKDHEDMHLMAMCQHHIIANSSFSWWGAWLNPDPQKRVVAPARWFNQAGHYTGDLIPPAWTCL